MDSTNLVLGVLGGIVWAAVLIRWYTGAAFGHLSTSALVVAMATVNVILIFGSLRLLGMLSTDLWDLVGTGGRIVFDMAGIVALLDSTARPGTSRVKQGDHR